MIDFAEFKKFFIYNMIGSLIVCALVAVVSVLVGDFTETAAKTLLTLFMITVHSLIALTFIWDDSRQGTFERLSFFINVIFLIIVLSFFTSIFGIWDIISWGTVSETYSVFFVLMFAALHSDILSKALNLDDKVDMVVFLNYIFIIAVVLMLLPVIYVENAAIALGEMFFRILSAAAIIDGTLSILTIIFYKLYMHNHPKVENPLAYGVDQKKSRGLSIWVWILIVYLIIQVVFPFVGMLFFRGF
jgi:hypothetical protein